MNKQKQAFTLVELIVVITILAILGTIAFISLQGYSAQSRDSVRITDIASMKTSLELFQLDAGKYPLPTDGTEITYSGGLTWTQGYFGEQTYKNVDSLDQIPLDPLTDKKYVYSTTNTRQEFQIAGVMEGEEVTFNRNIVNAGDKTALIKISGNYNGKLLKVSTGGTDYVLAVPSLMTSSGETDVVNIITNDELAYNGYKNLPYQYDGSRYDTNGDSGINLINITNLVVFSGAIKDLSSAEQVGIDARKSMLEGMQGAYTGTTIKNVGAIARILSTDSEDSDATELLTTNIVSNNLGGSIIATNSNIITYSCTGLVPISNVTRSNDTGLSSNTAWQNTNSGEACYFECSANYVLSGNSCESTIRVLAHFDNGTWVDESGGTINITGTTQLHTWINSKFSNSVWSGGGSSSMTIRMSSPITYGTDSFTIDFWYNPTSASTGGMGNMLHLYDSTNSNTSSFRLFNHDANPSTYTMGLQFGGEIPSTFPSTYWGTSKTGHWGDDINHFALVYDSGYMSIYIDGVKFGSSVSVASVPAFDSIDLFSMTTMSYTNDQTLGHMDEFRIMDGAQWTSNFTPPTAPY